MRSTKTMVALASLGILLMVSSAYAGPCGMGFGGGMGPGGGKGMAQWVQALNLTPEQQKQIGALRIEFMKKQVDLRSQIAKKRIEIMEMASTGKVDEETLAKKKQEMWSLKDAARNERRAMGTKFRALLTPEQREKIGPFGPGMGRGGFGGHSGHGFCPMMGGGMGRGGAGMRGQASDQ
jgi:Spy/CpxP family protein refolding chaperone